MSLETRSWTDGSRPVRLPSLNKWEKTQFLFAKVIGANIHLFIPFRSSLNSPFSQPTKVAPCCPDLTVTADPGISHFEMPCANRAFQAWRISGETLFTCPHLLQFASREIAFEDGSRGVVLVGPVFIGKREEKDAYRKMCASLRIDGDYFIDRLHEIQLFSFTGMQTILEFLEDITCRAENPVHGSKNPEERISDMLRALDRGQTFWKTLDAAQAAGSLLDIAVEVVRADSGSVMLRNPDSKGFHVRASHALPEEAMQEGSVESPETVAEWVAEQGRPVLLGGREEERNLTSRLRRNQIRRSMVIPIHGEGKLRGLLCLNAASDNEKFDRQHLSMLEELTRIAATAFTDTSTPVNAGL